MIPALPTRGELWWCEAPAVGRRPVVVLSRDAAIAGRRLAVVAPCSTRARGLASEVELDPASDPIPRPCVVALDSLESVSIAWCVQRLGRLSDARMREVCLAVSVALDC